MSISIDFINFEKIYKIASKYKNIWCTTGVHPNNVPKRFTDNEIEKLMIILKNLSKKVVGVGETGLDFLEARIIKIIRFHILMLIYIQQPRMIIQL